MMTLGVTLPMMLLTVMMLLLVLLMLLRLRRQRLLLLLLVLWSCLRFRCSLLPTGWRRGRQATK